MIVWRDADPRDLEPTFAADVDTFLRDSRWTWYVVSGFRSLKEQAKLWLAYKAHLDGTGPPAPRAAPPGKSAHNYGLAIDVVLDTDDGKPGLQPSWDRRLPAWVSLKTRSLPHPRLKHGWSFGDWPHIERFNWRRHVGWRP